MGYISQHSGQTIDETITESASKEYVDSKYQETTNNINNLSKSVEEQIFDLNTQISDLTNLLNNLSNTVSNQYFLGTNPIKSTAEDTVDSWKQIGCGWAWYDDNGQLLDQPGQWGFLINFIHESDVFQIFHPQVSGNIFYRAGNGAGWHHPNGYWTKIANV